MYRRFLRELANSALPAGPGPAGPIDERQLAGLPEPAQRYLRFMEVLGRPLDWSFRAGFEGRFRIRPGQPWMACEAWQYNTSLALARIFHIRIRAGGLFPIIARDTYVAGHGRLRVRLLDMLPLADGNGEEFDIGELVTYLGDAVLIAPSMLLTPHILWTSVAANSFDVTLTDNGHTVRGRVEIDERGAPKEFRTTDRFFYNPERPKELQRTEWSTPVAGWQRIDGRPLPSAAQAVWHLPDGPFVYADFHPMPGSLAFNVSPGE
jgi:hypothetical protein